MRFSEHLLGDGYGYAYGICAVDVDGDGRLDIVSADAHVGLYWYANNGDGQFERYVIQYYPRSRLERMACVDLSGNGFPDVVIVDNIHGDILIFENDGQPRAGRPWPCRYLAGPANEITREPMVGAWPHAYDVAAADLDGDGRCDIAATNWHGNAVAWFQNTADGWVQHLIEADLTETRTICVADFNDNGRPDLLVTAAGAGEVIWYEHPGDPLQPWPKHVIARELRPCHGHPAQIGGSGRGDVVMACGAFDVNEDFDRNEIVWYENTGSPARTPWPRHVVAAGLPHAFEAIAADLDGDGQAEIIATAWGGKLAVYKAVDDPRGPWRETTLKDHWAKANQVLAADLTGNGKPDLIACAERGSNEVRWWRNES